MARDVHDFYTEESTWQQNQRTDGSWTTPTDSTSDRLTTHTGRDDSTPTGRVNGQYITPTEYWAYFCYSTSSPGRLDAVRHTTGNTPCKRWWTGIVDNTYVTYGLDAYKQRPAMSVSTVSRAHAQVTSALKSGALQALQVVGEAREAGTQLGSLLREATRRIGDFQTYVRLLKSPKAQAQAYLTFVYGIQPLMNDAYATATLISDGLGKPPVGRVEVEVLDDSYRLPDPFGTAPQIRTFGGSVKRGVKIGHTFKVSNQEWFDLWRYGVTNPLATAWELVTLSFVIDWFTGLGNFLEGLQRPLGLTHDKGYITYFLENTFYQERVMLLAGWTYKGGDLRGRVDFRSRAMARWPLAEFTGPLPYLDVGLTQTQIVNGLALLAARA